MNNLGAEDNTGRLPSLWGCILIGGKSSRMGQPKHLLPHPGGVSWLEATVKKLQSFVERIIVAGSGDLPAGLSFLDRIEDEVGLVGPLAGLISAMKQYPGVSWLLTACDMPLITEESVEWLVAQRSLSCRAVIPQLSEKNSRGEPLFACYENSCLPLLEDMVLKQCLKISNIRLYNDVCLVTVPPGLRSSWTNVNTPADVEEHLLQSYPEVI